MLSLSEDLCVFVTESSCMRKFMSLVAVGAMLAFADQAQAQLGLSGGAQSAVGNAGGRITGKATGGGVAGQPTDNAANKGVTGQANGQISGNGVGQSLDANQGGAVRTGDGALNANDQVGVGIGDGSQVPALNNGNGRVNVGVGGNANVPGAIHDNGRLNTGVGGNVNPLPGQLNTGVNANGQINGESTIQGGAATGQRITAYSQGAAAGNLSTNNGWSNVGNYRRGFRFFSNLRNRRYYR